MECVMWATKRHKKTHKKQNSYNSFRHLKVEIRIMLKIINFNSCDFDRIHFNQLNELLFRIHLFVPLEYEHSIKYSNMLVLLKVERIDGTNKPLKTWECDKVIFLLVFFISHLSYIYYKVYTFWSNFIYRQIIDTIYVKPKK